MILEKISKFVGKIVEVEEINDDSLFPRHGFIVQNEYNKASRTDILQ